MNRAILPNFGFEYELCDRPVPRPAVALEDRFAGLLRLVPGWRDAPIHSGGAVDELLCWGWSKRACALSASPCTVDVVRIVNDKCFSHGVARQLGVAPRGARVIESVEDAERAAGELGSPWIVKHPFGVAGREQARGSAWDATAAARVTKIFESTDRAVFEPQMQIAREFSVHFDCAESGPEFVGVVALLADRSGTFRGNSTLVDVSDDICAIALDAARAVTDAGYRGPLGIDGFETSSNPRPISEINARWSFGRLAIELADMLGRPLTWHHGPGNQRIPNLREVPAHAPSGYWLLPEWCDPSGVSGTWIQVSD